MLFLLWAWYMSASTNRVTALVKAALTPNLQGIGYNGPRDKVTLVDAPTNVSASYYAPSIHYPETDNTVQASVATLLNQNPNMPPFKIISTAVDLNPSGAGSNHLVLHANTKVLFDIFPGVTRSTMVSVSISIPEFKNSTDNAHY